MQRQRIVGWIGSAVILIVSLAGAAAPERERSRVPLEFKRDPRATAQRSEIAAPQAPDVPDDIKLPARTAPKTASARVARPSGSLVDVEGLAEIAGERTALEAVHEWGWRQYWRAGFHRGLRDAMRDPRPGGWDWSEGFRYGRLDPRALALGGEIAQQSAQDAASRAASESVREQFSDLSRDPRRRPAARSRGDVARLLPAGPWGAAPILEDVFIAMPIASAPGLGREARIAVEGWDVEPASLSQDVRGGRVYDGAWKDAGYAFSVWRDRQRAGSYWSRFGPGERERFRVAFFARFDEVLASTDPRSTYAGFRVGYADGWRYGVAVDAEWNYRQGYAEGFDAGVRAAAATSFPFLYDRAYAAAYDATFAHWAHSAVPEAGTLRIEERDDDGVIEPGERVRLRGELVNYGGAPGTFELRADGRELVAGASTLIRFPARSRVPLDGLELTVSDRTAPRTQGSVEVSIGDEQASVPLYVSRPLEIEGDAVVDADRLDGRVRLVLRVANRSRRDLRVDARFADLDGSTRDDRTASGAVRAGGRTELAAAYDGLRPLDLLAGGQRWRASISNAGVENDLRDVALAPASTDLADGDLLTFTIDLARTRRPSPRDVAQTRALLLDRMRADWEQAVAMDGNPYKRDYEEGSASTALGALVRATQSERHSFVNRDVFAGLGPDIASLAEDLPGAHPVLRKWMKRLAKRVG